SPCCGRGADSSSSSCRPSWRWVRGPAQPARLREAGGRELSSERGAGCPAFLEPGRVADDEAVRQPAAVLPAGAGAAAAARVEPEPGDEHDEVARARVDR